MQIPLLGDMLDATALTKTGRLAEAAATIKRLLHEALPPRALEPRAGTVPGGRFGSESFSGEAGSRSYKLYIPSGYHGQPVPLVVMLHGCAQSPDDFATGTRMNEAGEANTCLIAYPAQSGAANPQRCWNWFQEADQRRDQGEPAIIAGITRRILSEYAIDPRRVYVAGLSAGGAQAAIMGAAYPDLYAAVGVHSGLACGAARDLSSAMTAMRQGGRVIRNGSGGTVPTIVFHGDRDGTVHPRNGDAVIEQALPDGALRVTARDGQVPGGHTYTTTRHTDRDGRNVLEQWVIHGAGHAWAGGSAAGTFTDPTGPDATKEMLRFFLEHRRG